MCIVIECAHALGKGTKALRASKSFVHERDESLPCTSRQMPLFSSISFFYFVIFGF